MIKINLYDYREELKRITVQKRVLQSASMVAAFMCLILFTWLLEKSRISAVQMELADLEQQVNALQPTVNLVKGMQRKQSRVEKILTGIEGLRTNQMQATGILFDVNQKVPEEVWLTSVSQKSKKDLVSAKVPVILFANSKSKPATNQSPFFEITGYALEDQSVARFVERLEQIPYFNMVFLFNTEYQGIGKFAVRKFTIYCYMPGNGTKKVT